MRVSTNPVELATQCQLDSGLVFAVELSLRLLESPVFSALCFIQSSVFGFLRIVAPLRFDPPFGVESVFVLLELCIIQKPTKATAMGVASDAMNLAISRLFHAC
jgi:hypothetical protein